MDIKAYGKLNLSLDITGILDNGYHSVSMVMQSVELCDVVSLEKNDTGEISVVTDNGNVPCGYDNIAYKACQLMKDTYGLACGFNVKIKKNIPVAGGMAGGSTDAAAVIRGINEICELNKPQDELMAIGLKLGADVPFCIQTRCALAEGIGEKLTSIKGLSSDFYILLVNPNVSVSTKEIYQRVDKYKMFNKVDNIKLVESLETGNSSAAFSNMKNVMQDVTSEICPEIANITEKLESLGAEVALMSGSGATCYGVFADENVAKVAQKQFDRYFTAITRLID